MKVKQAIVVEKTQELEITDATLLSIEEAEELPLRLRKYTSRWWLRSPGYGFEYASYAYRDGSVDDFGDYVDIDSNVVRPALQIKNLNSSNLQLCDTFDFGGKPFEIISNNLAFCLDDIGFYCFRRDCEESDANDYRKSDVKKFVDDWFVSAVKDCKENTDGVVNLSEFSEYVCSNCGKSPKMQLGILPDYCPWCGKKMIK